MNENGRLLASLATNMETVLQKMQTLEALVTEVALIKKDVDRHESLLKAVSNRFWTILCSVIASAALIILTRGV